MGLFDSLTIVVEIDKIKKIFLEVGNILAL